MRRILRALVLAVALPAAAVAATITIDETTPETVWEGIVEGFPGFPGRVVPNPLSVVRRGQTLQLRSVMEFPLAALGGIAPDAIISATLTFNIDDVLSTLGPGTELSGQAAEAIPVHFYSGDGEALPNDFDRTQEGFTAVDTGPGTITDATLEQSGPIVLTVDARARVIQALAERSSFLGVLWRATDNPTGTSIDDGRGGSASGEPSNTVPGSRMPFLTIEVTDPPSATCGNGVVETGEQCDDGNTLDGDCCSRQCAFDPGGTPCSDGNTCTTADTCDGAGACVAGAPRNCDDGNACTSDACDPAAACVHLPGNDGGACDDGNVCTSGDVCSAGRCAGSGIDRICDDGNPCTAGDTCVEGICQGTPDDGAPCDDGNGCTDDACLAGACQGIPADGRPCDDGNGCTDDACLAGACQGIPADGRPCDDGNPCTGADACTAGACGGGTVCGNGALETGCGEECDDGNPSSSDGCSSGCRYDALVGGDGPEECLVRVALGSPLRDGGGAITAEQSCTDGDPTCDADPATDVCGFAVAGCFGLADARLPGCGPATSVKATVVQPRGAGVARNNRRQLITALRAVSMPGCMQPVTVRVPVRRRGRRVQAGKTTVVLSAQAPGMGRDRDTIRLVCRPAS